MDVLDENDSPPLLPWDKVDRPGPKQTIANLIALLAAEKWLRLIVRPAFKRVDNTMQMMTSGWSLRLPTELLNQWCWRMGDGC